MATASTAKITGVKVATPPSTSSNQFSTVAAPESCHCPLVESCPAIPFSDNDQQSRASADDDSFAPTPAKLPKYKNQLALSEHCAAEETTHNQWQFNDQKPIVGGTEAILEELWNIRKATQILEEVEGKTENLAQNINLLQSNKEELRQNKDTFDVLEKEKAHYTEMIRQVDSNKHDLDKEIAELEKEQKNGENAVYSYAERIKEMLEKINHLAAGSGFPNNSMIDLCSFFHQIIPNDLISLLKLNRLLEMSNTTAVNESNNLVNDDEKGTNAPETPAVQPSSYMLAAQFLAAQFAARTSIPLQPQQLSNFQPTFPPIMNPAFALLYQQLFQQQQFIANAMRQQQHQLAVQQSQTNSANNTFSDRTHQVVNARKRNHEQSNLSTIDMAAQCQKAPMKSCNNCSAMIHRNSPVCPECHVKSKSKNPKKSKKKVNDS